MPANFKGRLEMEEDFHKVSRQMRIDRIKKVREKEQQLAMEKSELYRQFIEESKRERLVEKKKQKAAEMASSLKTLNNQWCLALTEAGAAHRDALAHLEQEKGKIYKKQEAEMRRQEVAERRMAIAVQKVHDEEIRRKHKEREILILKQLRDQERWVSREDAHAYGETRQVQESKIPTEKIHLTKQSAESVYQRFPIKITPTVIRHGVVSEGSGVINRAIEEEVVSRKIAWKNIMKEMKRNRVVKERASTARFKTFRTASSKQLEEELKILHKFDKAGLRNWRVKEALTVAADDASEVDIKINFEKMFMNVRPDKGFAPSSPNIRAGEIGEVEKSFTDDASHHSLFDENISKSYVSKQTADSFWIDFNSIPETDSHWHSVAHANISTDSATTASEEELHDSEEEDEPIRTIVPQIPHPDPIAWTGSKSATNQNTAIDRNYNRQYAVESLYGPQTDVEESSPDTSSVLEYEDDGNLLLDSGGQNKSSFRPFASTVNTNSLEEIQKSTMAKKDEIIFDDSELSNETSVNSVHQVCKIDAEFSTSSHSSANNVEEAETVPAGMKRGTGQRLPSMSSLGASTQTSDLTKQSDTSNSDFEDVVVATIAKKSGLSSGDPLSYPSLSSSSLDSNVESSLSSPPQDKRQSRQMMQVNESTNSLQSSDQSIESIPSTSSSKLSDLHEAIHNLDVVNSSSKVKSSSSSTSSSPASSLSTAEMAKYQKYLAASDSPVKSAPSTAKSGISPFRKSFPERFDSSDDEAAMKPDNDFVNKPMAKSASAETSFNSIPQLTKKNDSFTRGSIPTSGIAASNLRKEIDESETSVDYRATESASNNEGQQYRARTDFSSSSVSTSRSDSPAFTQNLVSNILKRVAAEVDDSSRDEYGDSGIGADVLSHIPTSKRTQGISSLNLSDSMDSTGILARGRAVTSTVQDRLLLPTGASSVKRSASQEKNLETAGDSALGLSVVKPSSSMSMMRKISQTSTAADHPQEPARSSAISPPPHPSAGTQASEHFAIKNSLLNPKSVSVPVSKPIVQGDDSDSSAELDRHIAHLSLNLDTSSQVSQRLLQGSTFSSNTGSHLHYSGVLSQAAMEVHSEEDSDMDEDSISGESASLSQHHLFEARSTSILRSSVASTHPSSARQSNAPNESMLNSTIMTTSSMTRSSVAPPVSISDVSSRKYNPLNLDSSSSDESSPSASFLTGDGDQPSFLYTASNATLSEIQHEIYDMRQRLLHAVSYPQAPVSTQSSLLSNNNLSNAASVLDEESNEETDNYIQSILRKTDTAFSAYSQMAARSSPTFKPKMVYDEDLSSDDSLVIFEQEILRRKAQQQEEIARRQLQKQQLHQTRAEVDSSMEDSLMLDIRMKSKGDESQDEDDLMLTEQSLSSQSTPRKYRVDHAVITSTRSMASNSSHAIQRSVQQQQQQQQQQQSASSSYILQEHSTMGSEESETLSEMFQQSEPATKRLAAGTATTTTRRVTIADANNIYHSPPTSMILSEQSLSISPMTPTSSSRAQESKASTPHTLANSGASTSYYYDHNADVSSDLDILAALSPSTATSTPAHPSTHGSTRQSHAHTLASSSSSTYSQQTTLRRYSNAMATDYTSILRGPNSHIPTTTSNLSNSRTVPLWQTEQQREQHRSSQQQSNVDASRSSNNEPYDPLEHEQVLVARHSYRGHSSTTSHTHTGEVHYEEVDFEEEDFEDDTAFERDLQRTLQFIREDRGSDLRAGRQSWDRDSDEEESNFDLLEEQSF